MTLLSRPHPGPLPEGEEARTLLSPGEGGPVGRPKDGLWGRMARHILRSPLLLAIRLRRIAGSAP